MESFTVGWNNGAELPGTWSFFILDWGHLFETVFKALGFFGIKSIVVEDEFCVGEVFAKELAEVVFVFLRAVVFVHWEDEFVKSVFSDGKEELVVLLNGDYVLSFVNKFS